MLGHAPRNRGGGASSFFQHKQIAVRRCPRRAEGERRQMHAFLGSAVLAIGLTGTLAASAQIRAAAPTEAPAQESSAAPAKDQTRLTASAQETTADQVANAPAVIGTDGDDQPKAESFHQRSGPRGPNPPTSLVELCDTLISSARAN